jgi:hypothetical protein
MNIKIVLVVILLVACGRKKYGADFVRYIGNQQLLTLDSLERDGREFVPPEIIRYCPDSIAVGEELLIKIFLKDSDLRLVNAYVGCKVTVPQTVDTSSYRVSGCTEGLVVRDDTIMIGFRPMTLGLHSFSDISILTKDPDGIFRLIKYRFQYRVVEHLSLMNKEKV